LDVIGCRIEDLTYDFLTTELTTTAARKKDEASQKTEQKTQLTNNILRYSTYDVVVYGKHDIASDQLPMTF